MAIIFYGDPHGNFKNLFRAVNALSPEAVVILGDFGLKQPLEKVLAPILNKIDIWFIHGNHDTDNDNDYQYLFNSELADHNLHGKVVEIAGYKIAGLGGIFREKIWHPQSGDGQPSWLRREDYMYYQPAVVRRNTEKYGGLPRKDNSSIWKEDIEKLTQYRADILVSHEAPSCHSHGFPVIDELAQSLGVQRIFHGHHHTSYQSMISTELSTIIVDGVDLAQCKDEWGHVV